MIRYVFVLIFSFTALLTGCSGCAQEQPYTGDPNPLWNLHKVYGRVKTLKTEYFEPMIKNGQLVPGSAVGESYTIDSIDAEGKLLNTKIFELGGGLKKTEMFLYNAQGQLIAIETKNGGGEVSTNQDLYYNTKGQKTKQVVTIKTADGDLSYWRTWLYDEKGQIVESYVYRSDTTVDNRETLTYYEADSGKIHLHSLYIGMDTLKYRNEYIYNSSGLDSILHRYRPLGKGDSVGYQSRYEYTHDSLGNELTRKLISPDGTVKASTQYEYQFDHHNNWTHRIETVDGEPAVIKVRTFTYYNE